MDQVRVFQAEQPCQTEQVARLLRDYLLWLRRQFAHAPDFVDDAIDPAEWESELADLSGHFGAPHGAMLLATFGATPAGCALMRGIGKSTCEITRLFVRPAYQGHGIARCLVVDLSALAQQRGYQRIVAHAGRAQSASSRLYQELGFKPAACSVDARLRDNLRFFEGQTRDIAAHHCVTKPLLAAA